MRIAILFGMYHLNDFRRSEFLRKQMCHCGKVRLDYQPKIEPMEKLNHL